MSMYEQRLDAIMEIHDCNRSNAVEYMGHEFDHDELPVEDEVDRIMRANEDD